MNQAELLKHVTYDPTTGDLVRISRKGSNGSIDHYGYLIIKIKGRQYKAHRLAWLYVYGEFPDKNIDHINGDKLDNRISNLRCVEQAENCRNATIRANVETGYKGVTLDKTNGLKKKYAIKVKGKTIRFYCPKEAYEARVKLIKEHGYGERHY